MARAVRSAFIAEHLADPALRGEIHEGSPVVEQRNSANVAIRLDLDTRLDYDIGPV